MVTPAEAGIEKTNASDRESYTFAITSRTYKGALESWEGN